MKALIDADILFYEIGSSSQYINPEEVDENGFPELVILSWDACQELFDKKIEIINMEVEATEPPLLFLTNTPFINSLTNKTRKWDDLPEREFIPVFRHSLAKAKPYKFGRAEVKPFHYKNLINYVITSYDHMIDYNGLEADDLMCIHQYNASPETTIICSRDKDLRQCPGWHYSWECGKQNSIGPILVDELGTLVIKNEKERATKKPKPPMQVFGTGAKWLYYQMLVGDATDNIGGAKNKGPVFAYELLKNASSERECFELTRDVFEKIYKEDYKIHMKEMANLVYMIRKLDEDGNYIMWAPPEK